MDFIWNHLLSFQYLTKKGHGSDTTQQVSNVEKTIAFQEKVLERSGIAFQTHARLCISCSWRLKRVLCFKVHQKNVQKRKDKIQQIKRKAAKKVLENAQLEEDIASLQAVLQERRETYKAIGNKPLLALLEHVSLLGLTVVACFVASEEQESEREKRYQKILQVKDLKSLVQIKEKEVATLKAEVERLRRRNFPLLAEPK